jgi:hypothetical protein
MAWDRQKYDIPGLWYGTSDFLARYMFFFAPDIKLDNIINILSKILKLQMLK